LLQWFADDVCSTPKFRAEAFELPLGVPKDFASVHRRIGGWHDFNLRHCRQEGTFEIGKEYELLNPGANFVIHNGMTGDEVKEISPLPAGKYAIAAGVSNSATGKQSLAVTYFTVKSDE
jgi:hypothetical protein